MFKAQRTASAHSQRSATITSRRPGPWLSHQQHFPMITTSTSINLQVFCNEGARLLHGAISLGQSFRSRIMQPVPRLGFDWRMMAVFNAAKFSRLRFRHGLSDPTNRESERKRHLVSFPNPIMFRSFRLRRNAFGADNRIKCRNHVCPPTRLRCIQPCMRAPCY